MEALLLTSPHVPLAILFLAGWSFALLLFSGFCAVTGLLIFRSRVIPRLIGTS